LYINEGKENRISFAKSYLCALSAELVFSQPETLVETKPFLAQTDLLDFPGARSRLRLSEDLIEKKNIPELLLRGKVAYLFNKYSDAEKINILMFCAKHEQAAQRLMPEMMNNWVEKIVGKTPEKREQFISKSKIPPLFVVSTFFNVNLQYNPTQDRPGERSSLDYRWNQRFNGTLKEELLDTETYPWFDNWTTSQNYFNNIFLLRDFEKSESISHIYKGYNEHKKEIEEVIHVNYPDFKEKLRHSFINNNFVEKHFTNAAESWDAAACINKDGTELIINKLTIAANNINDARRDKIIVELNEISQTIVSELKRFFHDGDKDSNLQKAKSIAGDIQHKLDTSFKADGIKLFGKMMKEFMLDEASVYKLYREKIDDIERRDVRNLDVYSTYRMQVPVVENDNPQDYFDRLCAHYEKTTEELRIQFKKKLDDDGVDLDELIKGNHDRIKNFSQQLAESLLEFWFMHVNQNDKKTIQYIFAQESFSGLQDLIEMFRMLFKKINLDKVIAKNIRHYVDGYTKTESAYEMIADISTEILNKSINNIGFDYFTQSDFDDLVQANEKNKLGLVFDDNKSVNDESITDLFEKIDNLPNLLQTDSNAIKSLPSYHNYIKWYNKLKIGFVSVCDIPNYDVNANKQLGVIINECETLRY
jgi:hypothetical protein